jgi:nitroreductase
VKGPVATRYPVLPALQERWSPRSFLDLEPDRQSLGSLFEAARLAPSAHNSQPWRFLLAREGHGPVYDCLFASLDPHNQEWAHSAPVLVLASVMRRRFSQITGDFVPYPHCLHDLGLATMALITQAQHVGLSCHVLAAFDPVKVQEELAIPPLFMPSIILAIGYCGPPEVLPPHLHERETARRTRRPLEEIVYEDEWGQASALITGARDESPGRKRK